MGNNGISTIKGRYNTKRRRRRQRQIIIRVTAFIILAVLVIAGIVFGVAWGKKNSIRKEAIACYEAKDYEAALKKIDEGIEKWALFDQKLDQDMILYKAHIFMLQGEFASAEAAYESLLNDYGIRGGDKKDVEAFKQVAEGLSAYNRKDYETAISVLTPMAEEDYPFLYMYIGSAHGQLGSIKKMQIAFDTYLKNQDMNGYICHEYAAYYLENGKYEKAHNYITEGLALTDDYYQELLWLEILYYEKLLDFNTAYDKIRDYQEKYTLTELEQKEYTYIRTRSSEFDGK